MSAGLPTFPVPAFAALALGVLALVAARHAEGWAGFWLPALILACAFQAALVASVQHYGVAALRALQPVTACMIPPLAWLTFQRTTQGGRALRLALLHLAAPIAGVLLVVTAPRGLDALLPAVFAGYGAAILWQVCPGADAVPGLRLGTGERPAWLWRLIGAALIGSAASDALIAGAIAAGRPDLGPVIVTFGSTAMLALIGWVAVAGDLRPAPARDDAGRPPRPPAPPAAGEADAALVGRLDALLANSDLHLDPDLSLARLARRLGVPAKRLSAAVNRVTGDNVSRHVNAHRVATAIDRLRAGETVTAAWLASGFAARSNFNREFKRITGEAPSVFVESE